MVQPLGRPSRASWGTNPRPRGLAMAGVRGRRRRLRPLWRRCCFAHLWGLGRAFRSPTLAVDRRRADRRFVLDSPVDCSRFAFIDRSAKRSRLRLAPSRSAGVASLGLLVWSWWPESLDPIRAQTAFDEVSMLVLGLVQVLAGVIVLVTVIPRALRALAAAAAAQGWWAAWPSPIPSHNPCAPRW